MTDHEPRYWTTVRVSDGAASRCRFIASASHGGSAAILPPRQRTQIGREVLRSMHVAMPELRALRQGGLVLRYAVLGSIAFVLAEVPETGSAGTSLETPSRQAIWALVMNGELTYLADGRTLRVPAGHALHVPAGDP